MKVLKQDLKRKSFVDISENAVTVQLWTAWIVMPNPCNQGARRKDLLRLSDMAFSGEYTALVQFRCDYLEQQREKKSFVRHALEGFLSMILGREALEDVFCRVVRQRYDRLAWQQCNLGCDPGIFGRRMSEDC